MMIHADDEFEELEIIESRGFFSRRTNSVIYGIVAVLAVANLWLWIGVWFSHFFINAASLFVAVQICSKLGFGDAFGEWVDDAVKCLLVATATFAPIVIFAIMFGFIGRWYGNYLGIAAFYLAAKLSWPDASYAELFLLAMVSGASATAMAIFIGY